MLAWLQKGTKRRRVPEPDTSAEVQGQPETSGTVHELQTNVSADVSGTASVNEEPAATNLNVNNNKLLLYQQYLQVLYFTAEI